MSRWLWSLLLVVGLSYVCCESVADVVKDSKWGKHHEFDEDDFGHQAVLGSKKEDAMWDERSPDESREKLKDMFHQMDLDKDEEISKEELTEWIEESLGDLNKEAAHETFRLRDAILDEEDEQVSFEEYVKEVYGMTEAKLKEMLEAEEHEPGDRAKLSENLRMDKKRFDMADVDKNDFLSELEHVAFVHPYDYEHMTQSEVDQFLKDSDKNGDGLISLDEYATPGGDGVDAKSHSLSEEYNFKSLDKDGNGFLDNDELLEYLKPDGEEVAQAETDSLFETTDRNQDDRLSVDEILEEMDAWIGHEATGFGDFFDRDFDRDEL